MRVLSIAALLSAMLLSACVYRQDIPQGNFFKQEDVAKLQTGMTREQVRFVMGTPMISDPFHPDRWDYVMYVDSQEEERNVYRRVTVFFEGNTLARIEKVGLDEEIDTSINDADIKADDQ
ncbi:MAG: outer membrane protein assembly factor BamE [Gammaproteobacteria bacterium]|nr:outer membrane protein assembly factor BamE [Gammaproteobacteria bacterium]